MTYLDGGPEPGFAPDDGTGFADSPLPAFLRRPLADAAKESPRGARHRAPAQDPIGERLRQPNQRQQRRMRRILRRKAR